MHDSPERMFMCLHAWKYRLSDGLEFTAPPPQWVTDRKVILDQVFEKRKKDALWWEEKGGQEKQRQEEDGQLAGS